MTRTIDTQPTVALPYELRPATPDDHDDLFIAYTQIVNSGDGFPHASPVSRADFDDYWIAHSSAVWIIRVDGQLAGAYYIKPNFVGRAAHISNAGYFVVRAHRRKGLGRILVEHSLREARRLGFDAMQFNLVFASNPAVRCTANSVFTRSGESPPPSTGRTQLSTGAASIR